MKFGSRRAFKGLLLLAPPSSIHDETFGFCHTDESWYNHLLAEAQRLRGRVYLQDGAVDAGELSSDGRLVHAADEHSWQLLIMNWEGNVAGCARYMPHREGVSFSELGIARSALAYSRHWGSTLRRAVEAERTKARHRGISFAEVGGWALSEELRFSTAALEIFLNVCGLAKLFGGAVALTTATFRHHSASILRRLGGHALVNEDGVELPPYYDPRYNCEMEILRFDTDTPNPRYRERIHECQCQLATVTAVCATPLAAYAMS
jgi:hypothetical protein